VADIVASPPVFAAASPFSIGRSLSLTLETLARVFD